jgi:hypothetical protein
MQSLCTLRDHCNVVRVAIILNPQNAASVMFLRLIEAAGRGLGIPVSPFEVRNAGDIERAFEARANEAGLGLIVLPEPVAGNNRAPICHGVAPQTEADKSFDHFTGA